MNVKNFVKMTAGCIILSLSVYLFEIPNNFSTGGVSGLGVILAKITPISAPVWIWGLNLLLLIVGFAVLGKGFGAKTIYCSMLYSAMTYALGFIMPLSAPITDETLLELIYSVILSSIACALIFHADASSGGTDILALIIKKYTPIDVGKAVLTVDFAVAVGAFAVFGVKTGMFSLAGLLAKAFVVDMVIDNLNACKYFVVITEKGNEISKYIMTSLERGVTVGDVFGAYTESKKSMIHAVCGRFEAPKLRKKIKTIDPNAFIIITTSSEILGSGFMNL